MKLKIYLLTQTDNIKRDTYDSCLVCAKNAEDAITIGPGNKHFEENDEYSSWAKKSENIICKEIGIANKNQTRGVVIASYMSEIDLL